MATVDEAGRELPDLATARPADARTRALPSSPLDRRPAIRGLLLGDHEGAIEDGNKAIRILHRAGDTLWESRAVGNRANSYVQLGRLDKVRADHEGAADMLDGLGQAYDAAITRHNLAMVWYAAGDLLGALRQIEQAIEEYEAWGPRSRRPTPTGA